MDDYRLKKGAGLSSPNTPRRACGSLPVHVDGVLPEKLAGLHPRTTDLVTPPFAVQLHVPQSICRVTSDRIMSLAALGQQA